MESIAESVSTLLKTIKENQSTGRTPPVELLIEDAVRITNSQHSKDYYRQKIEERGKDFFRVKLSELTYRIRTEKIDDSARYFTAMLEDDAGNGAKKQRLPKNGNLSNLPVWAEENTIQFPICILSKRYSKKEYALEYEDKNNAHHLWKIVARDERLPGPGARKVLRALEKLYGRNQNKEGKVEFSLYQLRQITGLSEKTIVTEIERLTHMAIFHDATLFDKATGKFVECLGGATGIFKNTWLEGMKNKEEKTEKMQNKFDRKYYEKGWVIFADWYRENYLARYVHKLPSWILSISPQASRLWELISSVKPDADCIVKIDYRWLCDRMPLKREKYFSDIKEQLKPHFKTLINSGAVTSWDVSENGNGWKVWAVLAGTEQEPLGE